MSYYQYKINIGVGGFTESGKSTLINSLLGEKRCFESQIYNTLKVSEYPEYTLKDSLDII